MCIKSAALRKQMLLHFHVSYDIVEDGSFGVSKMCILCTNTSIIGEFYGLQVDSA